MQGNYKIMNSIHPTSFSRVNFDSDSEEDIDVVSTVNQELQAAEASVQAKTASFIRKVMPSIQANEEALSNLKSIASDMSRSDPFEGIRKGINDLKIDITKAQDVQEEQTQTLQTSEAYYETKLLRIKELRDTSIPELRKAIDNLNNDPTAATLYMAAEKGASNMAAKGERQQRAAGKSYYEAPAEDSFHLRSLANSTKELIERIEREEKEFVQKLTKHT